MSGIGILSFLSGALQLTVPSYALTLVRRFGAQRVGWFIVFVFSCLALLRLLAPAQSTVRGLPADFTLDAAYAVGALLLLIGMGHTHTLYARQEEALRNEERLHAEYKQKMEEETAELARLNGALASEVARREQSEKALAESATYYHQLFMENPAPTWIFDRSSGRILAANHAAIRQYGFDSREFVTLAARDLIAPEKARLFLEDAVAPNARTRECGVWQHCRKDGSRFNAEVLAADIRAAGLDACMVVACDVTERHYRELRLRRDQSLKVITRMSAGVARHLQPLLAAIDQRAASLRTQIGEGKAVEDIRQISAATTRGMAISRQLLAVGAELPCQPQVLDINSLLRGMNHMLNRLVGERITVEFAYGSYMVPMLADPKLMEHVLVNLVLNARDAMPEGGTITISTSVVRGDACGASEGRPGEFVRLSVRDTGRGIGNEIQEHLFEPCVTTKDGGRALGLGLASVRGIVHQHNGWVEFATQPGAGSEFLVFIPCAPADVVQGQPVQAAATLRHKGTVLLVDPDDRARNLARCALNWQGYRVIEADSTSLALTFWQSQAAQINLLLTELALNDGSTGFDLANQLQQTRQSLKVIYTGCESPDTAAQIASLGAGFLAKPFTPDKLLKSVQQALDSGEHADEPLWGTL